PRLIRDRNFSRYALTYIPLFLGLVYVLLRCRQYVILTFGDGTDKWVYSARFALSIFMAAFLTTAFVGLLKFIEDYFELENRQLDSELRFLKAQVNPHFLFNTLNNLYYLAVNQSEQTPEVVAKLSGMMRYMIHESNTETVPLSKEVAYMEHYLDLEKLRLNEAVPITFEVDGDLSNSRIRPLILITFLENAFKHGISNNRDDSWITARLSVTEGKLHYRVANSMVAHDAKTVREASGIGLVSVRRRLALSYPGKHTLDIHEDADRYRVDLKIELS
ncbi:MAG: histidine kinase, partial [Bacteroidota bacterium]